MPYVCGMKTIILRRAVGVSAFWVLLLFSRAVTAQTGFLWFDPDSVSFTADSIGSTFAFTTNLDCSGLVGEVILSGSNGVVSYPKYVDLPFKGGPGKYWLTVTVQPYNLGCFMGTLKAGGGS